VPGEKVGRTGPRQINLSGNLIFISTYLIATPLTMSIEIASLSKEDKRARKEEKRRRKEEKAAKAAAAGQAGELMDVDVDVVVPVASTSTSGSAVAATEGSGEKEKKKKEKKDKKRKRDAEDDAVVEVMAAPASTPADSDKEAKKSKKDMKDKKDKKDKKAKKEKKDVNPAGTDTISSTPAETVLTTPAEPVILGASENLSKKQLKKIAKAATSMLAPSAESSPAPPTVAAATTASISTVFNAEQNAYLASNSITLTPSVYPPILSIPSLPVHPKITSFLSKFDKPTPIQSCAWPALLSGRDVVGVAETGSGKTLSFGVPGIHLLSTLPSAETKKSHKGRGKGKGQIKLLVLAPTRELALQSHETLEALGQELGVGSVCIYGGVGKDEQIRAIADPKTKVVVGTPGRVLDLADSGELDLSQ
jgi:ATP-dependent RNA helicase DBP3